MCSFSWKIFTSAIRKESIHLVATLAGLSDVHARALVRPVAATTTASASSSTAPATAAPATTVLSHILAVFCNDTAADVRRAALLCVHNALSEARYSIQYFAPFYISSFFQFDHFFSFHSCL